MNYSDFHKNRVRYNINATNKAKSKICINLYYLDTEIVLLIKKIIKIINY